MDQSEYIVTYIDWDKIDIWCCDRYFTSLEIDQHVEKVHERGQTKAVQDDSKDGEKSKEKVHETGQTKTVQDDQKESEKSKENVHETGQTKTVQDDSKETQKLEEKVHEKGQTKPVQDDSKETEQVKAEKKVYLCKICPKSFFNQNIVKIHMKTHKKNNKGKVEPVGLDKIANEQIKKATDFNRKYSCYICDKIFKHSGDLEKHKRVHTKEKPFSCSYCGKTFSQSCNRNKHIQLKHSPLAKSNPLGTIQKLQLESDFSDKLREIDDKSPPIKGDFIQNQDKFVEVLGEEALIEIKEKKVNVNKLRSEDVNFDVGKNRDEVFKPELLVKNQNGENFLCSYTNCSKSFATKSRLKQHMFGHTGSKPFKCDECEKAFNRKSSLKNHNHIHVFALTGAKPFKCEECAKSFARKSILKNHKLIHTRGLKLLKCDDSPMEKDETIPEVQEENKEEVSHEKIWSQNSKLLNFPVDETIEPT